MVNFYVRVQTCFVFGASALLEMWHCINTRQNRDHLPETVAAKVHGAVLSL